MHLFNVKKSQLTPSAFYVIFVLMNGQFYVYKHNFKIINYESEWSKCANIGFQKIEF